MKQNSMPEMIGESGYQPKFLINQKMTKQKTKLWGTIMRQKVSSILFIKILF